MAVGYLKNYDYSELIDKAVATGNMKLAAQYEQQRNAKIDGEGLNYEKTNLYSQFLKEPQTAAPRSSAQDTLRQLEQMSYGQYQQGDEYKALMDDYQKRAQLSMQDTLGEVSARTGGIASSYATQAAQQSYNAALDAAEDEAYGRYNDEYDKLLALYERQAGIEQTEYSRYMDGIELAMRGEAENYQREQDAIALGMDARQMELQQRQQELENFWYEREYADRKAAADRDYALDLFKATQGETASADPYANLTDTAVINALKSRYNKDGKLSAEDFYELEKRGYKLDENGQIVQGINVGDHTTADSFDASTLSAGGQEAAYYILSNMDRFRGANGMAELFDVMAKYGLTDRDVDEILRVIPSDTDYRALWNSMREG